MDARYSIEEVLQRVMLSEDEDKISDIFNYTKRSIYKADSSISRI